MCHDHDSRPPAPPRTGAVAVRAALTLTSADGTAFSAACALPAEAPRTGVVILPDVRGLHPYYVALAERFAEAGTAAVAIDWFEASSDGSQVAIGTSEGGDELSVLRLISAVLHRARGPAVSDAALDLRPAELGIVVPLVLCLLALSAWPAAISDRAFPDDAAAALAEGLP